MGTLLDSLSQKRKLFCPHSLGFALRQAQGRLGTSRILKLQKPDRRKRNKCCVPGIGSIRVWEKGIKATKSIDPETGLNLLKILDGV